MQRFIRDLAVRTDLTQKAKTATIEAVAAATGLNVLADSSTTGATFTMTAESAALLKKYREYNPDGPVAGIIRGVKGQIASTAKFEPAQVNPMMVSNVAALSAAAALKAALADLEKLVEAMDVKLDRLLSDNRAKALGDVQGITMVLEKAYTLYQETNRISETTWAQIANHGTSLGQASSHALNQLDFIADSLISGSATDRSNAITAASKTDIRSWLVLLAACSANQDRFDALEVAHVAKAEPNDVDPHLRAIKEAELRRRALIAVHLQKLNDAVSLISEVNDFSRVVSPLRSRATLNAAEKIQTDVACYANVYKLDGLVYGKVERESWRKSLSDLTTHTKDMVGTAGGSLPGAVSKIGPHVQKLREIERPRLTRSGRARSELVERPGVIQGQHSVSPPPDKS